MTLQISVLCDSEGCPNELVLDFGGRYFQSSNIAAAIPKYGWVYIPDRKHLCPLCIKGALTRGEDRSEETVDSPKSSNGRHAAWWKKLFRM